MKSFYPNTKIKTDDEIVKALEKIDAGERTDEAWEKRKALIKLLKTPAWLR